MDEEIDEIRAHIEATDQFVDRLKAAKNDNLNRRIEQAIGNVEQAAEVISNGSTALQALKHGTASEQFGSLLALTFIHKNTASEYCEVLMHMVQTVQDPILHNLAIFSLGNAYHNSRNTEAIQVLDSLNCVGDKVLESAILSARSSVLGEDTASEIPEVAEAEVQIAKAAKWLSEFRQRFPNIEGQ